MRRPRTKGVANLAGTACGRIEACPGEGTSAGRGGGVRDTRIQQLIEARRIGAHSVYRLRQRLDEVLNAVQLGITLASLALGWIGEPVLARMVESVLGKIPYSIVYAHAIAFAVAFILI